MILSRTLSGEPLLSCSPARSKTSSRMTRRWRRGTVSARRNRDQSRRQMSCRWVNLRGTWVSLSATNLTSFCRADPDPNTIDDGIAPQGRSGHRDFQRHEFVFSGAKTPARWTLTLNGTRPTAILSHAQPNPRLPPRHRPRRKKCEHGVFHRGHLVCDQRGWDKQPTDNLADAIAAVLDDIQKPGRAKVNAPGGPIIKMHAQAGILVFSGTWEETVLVRSTLEALKDAAIARKNKARETGAAGEKADKRPAKRRRTPKTKP